MKVTLTRLNKKHEDNDFQYIKSKNYPFQEKEKWFIMAGNIEKKIWLLREAVKIYFKFFLVNTCKAVFGGTKYEHEFNFDFTFPAGINRMQVHVRSNGYVGLDIVKEVIFTVEEPEEKDHKN